MLRLRLSSDPMRPASSSEPPAYRNSAIRIALFTGNYNHIPDGVSLTLNRLVSHLGDHGYEVLVFAPTVKDPPMPHAGELFPVPSVPVPRRPEYRLATGLRSEAKRRLEEFQPDIVHVATPDLLGMAAQRWAAKRGIPVVSTYHTHFVSYLPYFKLGWAEPALWSLARRFYGRCRHVYVPSPTMADVLRSHGIKTEFKIWARGVETDRFDPSFRSEEWRSELGFQKNDVVVSFVSRLVSEKGLDIYASVVRELQARGLSVRALVVGEGPAGGALAEQLPGARFTGHLSGEQLATAYASSDIFLFPSETETFGNVILEAMASGLPAVCAVAAGGRDLVVDGKTGLLCPPRDRKAFLDATARLVVDEELRRRMGVEAADRAASFRWPVILERIEHYYAEVLDETGIRSERPRLKAPATVSPVL